MKLLVIKTVPFKNIKLNVMGKIATQEEARDKAGLLQLGDGNKCCTKQYVEVTCNLKVSGNYDDNQLVQLDDLSKAGPTYGGNTLLTLVSSRQNHGNFQPLPVTVTGLPSGVISTQVTIPNGNWGMFAVGIGGPLEGKYGANLGKVINSTDTSIKIGTKSYSVFTYKNDKYANYD